MNNALSRIIKIFRSQLSLGLIISLVVGATLVGGNMIVQAESFPGGTDNGKTSRLKQLNDELAGAGYGSPSNSPDWGAMWNRVNTSAKWVPSSSISASDVVEGKKFYNGSRSEQTGTKLVAGPCSTQGWHDSSETKVNSCSKDWLIASPVKPGDEKQDPVTGLVWSKCLLNNGGVTDFTSSLSCGSYSWDNSAVANYARTAIQLCTDRGNGWRLPTQKELMQGYIDGSYYNLVSTNAGHWSASENAVASAWFVYLSNGSTNTITKTYTYYVRCVR